MIIGISGKIGSGKDTVTEIIIEILRKYNYTCEHRKFSTRLKEVVAALTNTTYRLQNSHKGKDTKDPYLGYSYGQLQQIVGTTLRENISNDIWVNLSSYPSNSNFLIFSDVRFPNEYHFIKSKGGLILRVNGDPLNVRSKSSRDLNHISENSLDNFQFDTVFENNSSLEDLKNQVYNWIYYIIYKE